MLKNLFQSIPPNRWILFTKNFFVNWLFLDFSKNYFEKNSRNYFDIFTENFFLKEMTSTLQNIREKHSESQ